MKESCVSKQSRSSTNPWLKNSALILIIPIYRFHDHMPIRFNESIKWTIDWSHEKLFTQRADWPKKVDDGGCWIDYARFSTGIRNIYSANP